MKSILEEAAEHVEGRRQQDYGTPAENFYRVAQLWTAYLDGRGLIDLNKTDGITPTDFALMQALVKIARLEHGYHHDSVVDLAGYAACAAQINEPPLTFAPARCWHRLPVQGQCVLTAFHSEDHDYEVGNETPSGSETSVSHGMCEAVRVEPSGGRWYCAYPSGHTTSHRDVAGQTW